MTPQEVITERKRRSETMRQLRKSKGISQLRMKEISGLSLPTIVRMETGSREWRIDSEIIYLSTLATVQR